MEDRTGPRLEVDQIIGESPAIKRALALAQTVSLSDATVLLLGETGTGKELVALAIHRASNRGDKGFIKLNCAAIPTGLLESELFGHAKGAFTGAIREKLGRLDLADGGTLFLDEIGELPLELQPKLLRLLQDYEFERLGSTRTIHVDVRLIAATNRDLEAAMLGRQFREDLFYRLNVFPIQLPPLRERHSDIPLLVTYFLEKYAKRMGKHIESVPNKSMDTLVNWNWPGNIRELENFIERSVILSPGSVLAVPLSELQRPAIFASGTTLESMKRDHIIRALRESRGLVSGPNGAAARLGVKRTTLQSQLQRLGISPREYRNDQLGSTQ